MTAFALQLFNFIYNHQIRAFLIFFLIVQIFWWVRVFIASKNKAYEGTTEISHTVIIAVLREDAVVFERCLRSIREYGNPVELIVSIDDYSHADKAIRRIAKKYATSIIEQPRLMGKREQYAIATERMKKPVEVVITVDSDTIWDETTKNILQPFNDPKVGAVSGRQTIFREDDNYIRRIAQWFEDLRFRVTLPFQSYFGQVNVIPGRTLAARAGLYKDIAQVIRDERFLGRRIVTSDDASVTMEVIRRGYKAVYQSTSSVTTDAPNTLRSFLRQYLRWYRGAYRRFFSRFSQLARMNTLVFLSNIEFLFLTFVYVGILLTFIFKLVFGVYEFDQTSGFSFTESFNLAFILLIIVGFLVSAYVRNIPHFLHKKTDLFFMPIFAFFTFFFMTAIKIMSAFTMFENGWMTRQSTTKHQETGLYTTRILAAIIAIVIVVASFPLAYLIDISPARVPISAIISHDGLTYVKSRDIILASQDDDEANDPSLARAIHVYEIKYGKSETNRISAQCLLAAAQRANPGYPLNTVSSCRNSALAGLNPAKTSTQTDNETHRGAGNFKGKHNERTGGETSVKFRIASGESQSLAVRKYLASMYGKSLKPYQRAYIENRIVDLIGNVDDVHTGAVFTTSKEKIDRVIQRSSKLSVDARSAWSAYITY